MEQDQDHLSKVFRILGSIFLGVSVFMFARIFSRGFHFRGFMLKVAEKNYGRKAAVGITSLAFGLVHLMNGRLSPPEALSVVTYTGSMGVLMAVATLKSGGVWNGVTIHWLANVSNLVVSLGRHSSLNKPVLYTFSANTAVWLREYPYMSNFIYTAVIWVVIIIVCRPWRREDFRAWMR